MQRKIILLLFLLNLVYAIYGQNTGDFIIQDNVLVKYIGESEHIFIPDTVTSIGILAFLTNNLKSVTIPPSVTSIDEMAFLRLYLHYPYDQHRSLESIIVDEMNLYFSSEDGVLFNKDKTILLRYPENKKDTSYAIPFGVIDINEFAFCGNNHLTSVTIPPSVIEVKAITFHRCNNLQTVLTYRTTIVNEQAFDRTTVSIVYIDEYLEIGDRYILEGRLHEARSVIEEAIRLDPDYALSHLYLGIIYYDLNNMLLALESILHAIELDNTLAVAYFLRARTYQNLNDNAKALSDYNMALYLEPDNDRYHRSRGIFLYTIIGNSTLALVDFNRAVEINPLNYLNFQQRGVFFSNYGLHEMALEDHNVSIRLNSEDTFNFNNKGVSLAHLGRNEEALDNFNIAIQLDSNNYMACFNRAHVYFKLEMYNEAVHDLTEVIKINPNYRDAYFNRAFLYRLLADQAEDRAQAGYYRDKAQLDENVVARLDGQMEN